MAGLQGQRDERQTEKRGREEQTSTWMRTEVKASEQCVLSADESEKITELNY